MFRKFKSLSRLKKVALIGSSLVLLGVAGTAANPKPTTPVSQTSATSVLSAHTDTPKKPVITTKTVTETQPIPFTTTTVTDSSLPKGQTKITTPGVNGEETFT